MRLALVLTLGLAAWLAGAPRSVSAGDPTPLTDEELDAQRGGLQTPFGFDIGFGAQVRTFIDGELRMETQLTWTAAGAQVIQTAGAAPGDPAITVGPWTDVLPDLTSGGIRVLQDVSGDRIASLVINTTNDRAIRQDTDITIALPQLAELQQQMAADRIAAALQTAVGLALRDGTLR
jgi:hypothetical protein